MSKVHTDKDHAYLETIFYTPVSNSIRNAISSNQAAPHQVKLQRGNPQKLRSNLWRARTHAQRSQVYVNGISSRFILKGKEQYADTSRDVPQTSRGTFPTFLSQLLLSRKRDLPPHEGAVDAHPR
ncbi:hypothetical protein EVAR_62129_1 [Eumeta japonica]|uniref:Uncharacterized protein n=1 Tax=Eumeta variegata TaxID=151549 RepID=A0A4C1ZU92_EUMVA|nr:hypothetical protein EVAR_62129_1 [Eumeta japonica]